MTFIDPAEPDRQAASRPDSQPDPGPASVRAAVAGTGDERVDAAVDQLDELAGKPVSEHVARYGDVYQRLQETLASVDGT